MLNAVRFVDFADSTNYRSLLVQNGLYALGGLVTWKIGRGRWRYVAPRYILLSASFVLIIVLAPVSDLFKPGTFARRSLPASGPDYADSGQKLELQVCSTFLLFVYILTVL